jgi:nicotinate dehydrogenase subunit B
MSALPSEARGERAPFEPRFTRESLLQRGGALVIGFSLVGAAVAGAADAGTAKTTVSKRVNVPPDPNRVDSWIAINADGTVSLYPPKMDFGQGTWTGYRQIVAEELDVDVNKITIPHWDTGSANPFPNAPNSNTVASQGMAQGGPHVRRAAAEARYALLGIASTQLGVPVSGLTVSDGVVSGGGKSVRYTELVSGGFVNAAITGKAPLKPISQYKVVGTSVPRFDIPDKVSGKHAYIQNVRVPGMLHGRVVRPAGQAAVFGKSAEGGPASFTLLSVDESSIKDIPGARVVRRGNFLGVVAPREHDVTKALAQLKVKWAEPDTLPGTGNQYGDVRRSKTRDAVVLNYGNVDRGLAAAKKTVSATYNWPYQMHSPIGPVCAIADIRADGGTVWAPGQDGWGVRSRVAAVTQLPIDSIRSVYHEGASTFNSIPNYPTAVDAAIMSQIVGKPVRVQWTRQDMHGWEAYGLINVTDITGGLDEQGNLIAYDYTTWLPVFLQSPDPGAVQVGLPIPPDATVGASVRGAPDMRGITMANAPSTGARVETFSSGDQYFPNIPNRRVTGKTIPSTLTVCPLRAPSCIQPGWASEQMIDELAHAANADPLEFRRKHTTHPGWLGVLNAAAASAKWKPKVAASRVSKERVLTGRGISIAGENHANDDVYAAVVADIEVDRVTGKIVVKHLWGAQDSGVVVNPGLVESQIEGMLIRGTSRTLLEEVTFSRKRVTSLDWESYPLLRFKDHPNVTTIVISHPEVVSAADSASGANVAGPRYRGAGESIEAAVPAAIGNAFFDATGVRLRTAPMTPARVRAALKAAT